MLTILSCSYMLDQSLAVVDPDDCARGVEGYAPSGNAGGRALAGVCGGKAPLRPAEAGVLMHSV